MLRQYRFNRLPERVFVALIGRHDHGYQRLKGKLSKVSPDFRPIGPGDGVVKRNPLLIASLSVFFF